MTAKRPPAVPPPPARVRRQLAALAELYPNATCALHFRSPFELVVATVLSAQCTDKRVNLVTPALFARFPSPEAMASADPQELEGLLASINFYRTKAKNVASLSRHLLELHGGHVPRTLAELILLPGVARKTANVVLGEAFGLSEGVVVDTHVLRLAQRLGLTRAQQATNVERELMRVWPKAHWMQASNRLIHHGRTLCDARAPRCGACPLAARLCPSAHLGIAKVKASTKAAPTKRARPTAAVVVKRSASSKF